MNCYYHQAAPAVGLCKNCSKGLCASCAVDVTNGLSCRGTCEAEVRAINAQIRTARASMGMSPRLVGTGGLIYGLMAAVFAVVTFLRRGDESAMFTGAMAAIFGLGAVIQRRNAARLKDGKAKADATSRGS
jgi:hypothetical protein